MLECVSAESCVGAQPVLPVEPRPLVAYTAANRERVVLYRQRIDAQFACIGVMRRTSSGPSEVAR